MKSEKIGFYSAIVAGLATAIFAISILVNQLLLLSFGICIVLSFSFIILTCAFTAQANQDQKVFAYAGLSFATIYAVLINLVYFTQLTTVNQQAASKDLLNVLTYTPGSWMFSLDIFGYAMMAVSTFFVGLTILPISRTDKWLKTLFTLHGIFAFGIVTPMLDLFNGTHVDSSDKMGVIVLEIWSLYFIPMMILAAKHFKERCVTAKM